MRILITTLLFAGLLLSGAASAEDPASPEEAFTYIGAAKCRMCHKKEAIGQQYVVWSNGPHAKAFATLATEEAIAEAAKKGIENPQTAAECLRCHATAAAAGLPADAPLTLDEGVSCEGCHGPGSEYFRKRVMEGIAAGEMPCEDFGLTVITEKTCVGCHTPEGNSFYKEFAFEEALKRIAHPVPAAPAGESAGD